MIKFTFVVLFFIFPPLSFGEVFWKPVQSSQVIVSEYELDPNRPEIPEHIAIQFGGVSKIKGCPIDYFALGGDDASNIILVDLYLATEDYQSFSVAISNKKIINGMCTIVGVKPGV